jgi:5-methyltetrahydropteroyltriglutamate--homocysteine methyltransferase
MAIASNLGFPRIGARRELKKALENYWSGKSDEADLLAAGKTLRQKHWTLQKQLGMEHIPSNDFSFYDHVLDIAAMVGAVPPRYGWSGGVVDQLTYFAMARGSQKKGSDSNIAHNERDVPALEMTKWFDTNYHYIVPEFELGQTFQLASLKPVDEFLEAKALGIQTRPVLLGPISFLLLGKSKNPRLQPLTLLDALLPVYEEILQRLESVGAEWVQVDEPCLVLDLKTETRTAFAATYDRLTRSTQLRLLVATYFEGLRQNLSTALELPVAGLHVDLIRAPEQLAEVIAKARPDLVLSLGVVDGRNIWKTNLQRTRSLGAAGCRQAWV